MPENRWESGANYGGAPARSSFARFMSKRMLIMLAVVVAILVVIFGYITISGKMAAAARMAAVQPVTVATSQVGNTSWQTKLSAVGSLTAVQGADLAPVSSGVVTEIHFKPGEDVQKGQVLIQLRADAEKAAADLAMKTYKRDLVLIKTNAISQTDFDTAEESMKSTRAAVENLTVRAPFSGRVGIRQVNLGAYVSGGTTVVTLQELNPIYVDFYVPQQQIPQLQVGGKVTLTTDTYPGKTFTGKIEAFNPKVGTDTRTVQVRAEIENPQKLLLPGMFGHVEIYAGGARNEITLPQTAVTFNPYGDSVYVVTKQKVNGKEQLVAQQRTIKTGEVRGDQIAVLSGLKAGDVVISSGANKVRNGAPVLVNNAVKPPNDPNPNVSEETE